MKKEHSSPTIICYMCFFVRYKYLFVCWGGPPSTRQIPETWKIRSVSLTRFDCTLCGTWVGHWPFQTEKNWSSAKHGNSEISVGKGPRDFCCEPFWRNEIESFLVLKLLATLWFWGFFKGSTLSSLLQGLIGSTLSTPRAVGARKAWWAKGSFWKDCRFGPTGLLHV